MKGHERGGGRLFRAGIPDGIEIKGMLALDPEYVALNMFSLAPTTRSLREINVHAYGVSAPFEKLPLGV